MKEAAEIIHFWQEHLRRNRSFMAKPTIRRIEQTIKLLQELNQLRRG